jgi:hypothetical protein
MCVAAEEAATEGEAPKKTTITRETLAQVLRSVEAVMMRTKTLHGVTTIPPSLQPPKIPLMAGAVPLFNRLAVEGNVDALAGKAKTPPIVRPVELTSVPDACVKTRRSSKGSS